MDICFIHVLTIYVHVLYDILQIRVAPWFPGVVFGVMAVIAAGLTLLLPETLGRPLPQTIEEVENWRHGRNTQQAKNKMKLTVDDDGKMEKEKMADV